MTDEQATLKVRMSQERYLALMQIAHINNRSVNGQINDLVSRAITETLDQIKSIHRGQEGDSE